MKKFDELDFNQSVYYSIEHTWAKQNGELVTIGVSDYAQNQLGEIIYIEFPRIGDSFNANDVFGLIESVKTASDLYIPIGGEVVEVNNELEKSPESINNNPFEDGWIIKINLSDKNELQQLLTAEAYSDSLKDRNS